jgi:hypothetical protein
MREGMSTFSQHGIGLFRALFFCAAFWLAAEQPLSAETLWLRTWGKMPPVDMGSFPDSKAPNPYEIEIPLLNSQSWKPRMEMKLEKGCWVMKADLPKTDAVRVTTLQKIMEAEGKTLFTSLMPEPYFLPIWVFYSDVDGVAGAPTFEEVMGCAAFVSTSEAQHPLGDVR